MERLPLNIMTTKPSCFKLMYFVKKLTTVQESVHGMQRIHQTYSLLTSSDTIYANVVLLAVNFGFNSKKT